VQGTAHIIFFGIVLGGYVDARERRRLVSARPTA